MGAPLDTATPLLLVGAGKMGGAMLERWLKLGLDPSRLTVLDPYLDEGRRAMLAAAGATVAARPDEVSGSRPAVLVIAVKPQSMGEALPVLARFASAETVVVSIVAGVRIARLAEAFPPDQPIVRAMPNTPAQIGMGMTVAVSNPSASEAQRDAVGALLEAVGEVAWVEEEALIDAVTAVSGSGPAYVFLLAECLAEAGQAAGLPADLARRLGRQTVAGAGALLAQSTLSAETLRQNVTSPKGTTAAALEVLMGPHGLQQLMTAAVAEAKRRSIELG